MKRAEVAKQETLQEAVGDPIKRSRWRPRWILDEPKLGMTIDDDCIVVLTDNGQSGWCPMTHVPLKTVPAIWEILSRYKSDRTPL